ncbi:MAG TPA: 2Fe-2S iron-sulfur cluster-binding protein [Gemmatimonadaceae bacterium]|jgi:xanthine dehydrogenase YagT iron-sulfur-binding subunit
MRDLSEFRGSPVVLLCHSTEWNPAEREVVDTYNRLIARLPASISSGARLVRVGGDGAWRDLTFDDDALALPVIDADPSLAEQLGVGNEPAVIVLDADGEVRWRHSGNDQVSTADLARAVTAAAAPSCGATGSFSRRQFVATVFGVACAIAVAPRLAHAERAVTAAAELGEAATATHAVTLSVNGRDVTLDLESRVTLLDALREYAGLTGSKKGCDHGQCGACTVHVDGRRTLSCLTFAVMQQGKKITTIEGLAHGDQLDPMQQAFITHDGFQCGYCTSGQIMSATAMIDEPWGQGDDDVREAMSGNICRCGAYPGIVAAIQDVRSSRRAAR